VLILGGAAFEELFRGKTMAAQVVEWLNQDEEEI
jgi:hypothetical protein